MKRLYSLARRMDRWWADFRGRRVQRAAEQKTARDLHDERTKRLRALQIVNASPAVRLGQVRQGKR